MRQERRHELRRVLGDVGLFAQLHKVQDKASKAMVPLRALPMQARIFAAVRAGHRRILIIKARQVAATTGAKMVLHHQAYTTPHAAMHAVISLREDSAEALLDDPKRWAAHIPRPLQRPTKSTATAIRYTDTGASIRAYTSRSRTGLRSFAPAAALISEAAFAPDLAEVLAQVDAAVGEGLLIVESTANAPGDAFSELVLGAPENGWHLITLWWWEHPAYRLDPAEVPADFTPTPEEAEEQARYGLDLCQLAWRRKKVGLITLEKFRREYPGCLSDCFLSTSGLYYSAAETGHIGLLSAWGSPAAHPACVLGVDVGGGVGRDFHALVVLCAITGQPVAWERNNSLSPAQWAQRVLEVASLFSRGGPPLILCESNNHGHVVIDRLEQARYRNLWRDPQGGRPWTTTMQSKLEAHGELRAHLPMIAALPPEILYELQALQIPAGKLCPEAPAGGHDDYAMALALGYRALRDVPPSVRRYLHTPPARGGLQMMPYSSRPTGRVGGV